MMVFYLKTRGNLIKSNQYFKILKRKLSQNPILKSEINGQDNNYDLREIANFQEINAHVHE
jgi:hypothetical protein